MVFTVNLYLKAHFYKPKICPVLTTIEHKNKLKHTILVNLNDGIIIQLNTNFTIDIYIDVNKQDVIATNKMKNIINIFDFFNLKCFS